MKLTKSIEDYLEAVIITQEKYGKSKSIYISEFLNISKPAVTKAMNYLKENEYVTKESHTNIELTEKGKNIAEKIYEKHLKVKEFLIKLGVPQNIAEVDCCKIEHCISEETFNAIKNYLNK